MVETGIDLALFQRNSRGLLFELVAIAEKTKGNSLYRSGCFDAAIKCYQKSLAILGLETSMVTDEDDGSELMQKAISNRTGGCATDGFAQSKQFTMPRLDPESSCSFDQAVKLHSNCSMCLLKLGYTTAAATQAQLAIRRLLVSPEACNEDTAKAYLRKAKHHLASAMVRAGRFKEALTTLDEIDRAYKSPALTLQLRKTAKILQQECKPCSSICSHVLKKKAALLANLDKVIRSPSPENGWLVMQSALMKCPLLFAVPIPEVRRRIRRLPGKMWQIVKLWLRAQDPRQPYGALNFDGQTAAKIYMVIENSYSARADSRRSREEMKSLAKNLGKDFASLAGLLPGLTDDEDESDQDDEEVPQREILLLRWLLAYVQLDAQQWDAACGNLDKLIFHLTVHPGAPEYHPAHINRKRNPERQNFQHPYFGSQELCILEFPRYFLPELLYLRSLVAYGSGECQDCQSVTNAYFDLVSDGVQERTFGDMLYMQKWSELKSLQSTNSQAFEYRKIGDAKQLEKLVSVIDEGMCTKYQEIEKMVDTMSWVRARFYHDLGFNPLPCEYQEIYDVLKQRETSMSGLPMMDVEEFGSFERFVARAAGVTQRYRMSQQDQQREVRKYGALGDTGHEMNQFGVPMPDMEQELYFMQQSIMATTFGGLGGQAEDDEDEDEDEEEEEEEEEKEENHMWEEGEEEEHAYLEDDQYCSEEEAPAVITPDEAAGITRLQWESFIEQGAQRNAVQDAASPSNSATILCFSRHPRVLESVLQESLLGQQAMQVNGGLKPAWANGAKILVPGLNEVTWEAANVEINLAPFHVVTPTHAIDELSQLLLTIRYKDRPRLKHGTAPVTLQISDDPGDEKLSLFQDTSSDGEGSACATHASSAPAFQDLDEIWLEEFREVLANAPIYHLNVVRTFIEPAGSPAVTPRSQVTASAPELCQPDFNHSVNPRVWG